MWEIGRLALCLLLCFAAAGLGGLFTGSGIGSGWYESLHKPGWTPPAWVFGPVWTVLYILMAVSLWLVWKRTGWREGKIALTLFGSQLVLNALWSFFFFYLRSPAWGLAELVCLWALIAATLYAFLLVKTWAGVILVPYLAWVSFAGVLNYAIWRLNA
jgi:benzodiazapine receptor